MKRALLRSSFYSLFLFLCRPNPKPWHIIVFPTPFRFDTNQYYLNIDADVVFDEHVEWNRFIGHAENATSIYKKVRPNFARYPASDAGLLWVSMRDLGVSRGAFKPNDLDSPARKAAMARTHDGLTLQDVLVELLTTFPKENLSTDYGTYKTLEKINNRIAEVADFWDPQQR
ncbi:hypothetical protein NMY22_g6595 [Coprinellus aureogranulatus]|nr:hypothetical protein NMY22_g6595 [Coprinellus aureogranulatus]